MGVGELSSLSNLSSEAIGSAATWGLFGALIALGIVLLVILIAAIYVYTAFAWMNIAKKMKHKRPWLAWIPFANISLMLELGRFHWAWVFLVLIPIVGWIALFVMIIIATWRIFEARKYPGWYSLSLIIPKAGFILYLIAIGFVAWKDKKRR